MTHTQSSVIRTVSAPAAGWAWNPVEAGGAWNPVNASGWAWNPVH